MALEGRIEELTAQRIVRRFGEFASGSHSKGSLHIYRVLLTVPGS